MGESEFLEDMKRELEKATLKHGAIASLHEAYAVLLEEVDELWDHVRANGERNWSGVRNELIQIATMAWRAAIDANIERRDFERPGSQVSTEDV